MKNASPFGEAGHPGEAFTLLRIHGVCQPSTQRRDPQDDARQKRDRGSVPDVLVDGTAPSLDEMLDPDQRRDEADRPRGFETELEDGGKDDPDQDDRHGGRPAQAGSRPGHRDPPDQKQGGHDVRVDPSDPGDRPGGDQSQRPEDDQDQADQRNAKCDDHSLGKIAVPEPQRRGKFLKMIFNIVVQSVSKHDIGLMIVQSNNAFRDFVVKF